MRNVLLRKMHAPNNGIEVVPTLHVELIEFLVVVHNPQLICSELDLSLVIKLRDFLGSRVVVI